MTDKLDPREMIKDFEFYGDEEPRGDLIIALCRQLIEAEGITEDLKRDAASWRRHYEQSLRIGIDESDALKAEVAKLKDNIARGGHVACADEVARLDADGAGMRNALVRYGRHDADCTRGECGESSCPCGLWDVLTGDQVADALAGGEV